MTKKMNTTLGEDWLVDYAAGNLSFAHEMVIASHIELNPKASKTYKEVEAVGGALLEDLEPANVPEEILNDLMGKLSSNDEKDGRSQDHDQPEFLPTTVAQYFEDQDIELKWKALGPGMKRFPIWHGENDERLWLLKAKPGTPIPDHSHNGNELTLILTGTLVDGNTAFKRGDLEEADESIQHQPVVAEGEDCICLVVTEGPIKFKSILAKAIQPFVGL
jgi:putative transcriptional regulator